LFDSSECESVISVSYKMQGLTDHLISCRATILSACSFSN
jgi:hypothetical protein